MSVDVRNTKRRPTHPGAILREDVLPSLGISQTELARRLGVSRVTVSELVLEKRRLTPHMAKRLAELLNTPAERWIAMQAALDLWEFHSSRRNAI